LNRAFVLALTASLVGACWDPVHLDAIATLGPETPGVATGPTHRAGQPCSTCHGGEGPAEMELSIAGTLYAIRGEAAPLVEATVTITDARGEQRTMRSNATGNFFLPRSEWSPAFPLRAAIESEGIRREMVTRIGRDGACASCHRDDGDRTLMPGVFLRER
jgi:cytochrome c553